ncbi:stamen-specific protein FIL1 [Cynara cardunculus var. scolymus]|nr:stamen-specific protein FIL1 [Cynara cardunculus var. scolymus]
MDVFQMNQIVTLVLLVVGLVGGSHGQTCPNQLENLNVCAPFVVPGSTNLIPSSDCCVALEAVDHACLCNTIRVASSLPTQCNLPLSCGN